MTSAPITAMPPSAEAAEPWTAQPAPDHDVDGPPITDLVIADLLDQYAPVPGLPRSPYVADVAADLAERKAVGTARYGGPLRAHNGRNPIADLYEEVLDAANYWRQGIAEGRLGPDGDYVRLLRLAVRLRRLLAVERPAPTEARTEYPAEARCRCPFGHGHPGAPADRRNPTDGAL